MTLKSIRLPKTERFAASPSKVKKVFGDVGPLSAYLGALGKSFTLDSRCRRRPELTGLVVASLQVSRDRTAILQLYPLKVRAYPDEAAANFVANVLVDLRSWLAAQLAKPETAVLGYEEVVVEWFADRHKLHELRFL
jgi:hypothetical protein